MKYTGWIRGNAWDAFVAEMKREAERRKANG